MEEERREHVMKMKKMEAEMEQVFEMKVKEKKQKLKDSEAEVGFDSVCVNFILLYYRIPFLSLILSVFQQLTGFSPLQCPMQCSILFRVLFGYYYYRGTMSK